MDAHRRLPAALAGLLAGSAGLTASEAVAALLAGVTSPVVAVANRAVDAAPRPVKEWAVESFGTADKPLLVINVLGVVGLLAALIGIVGARRPWVALTALLALVAVAGAAALTDRAATAGPLLRLAPVAALALVGVGALALLLRTLPRDQSHLAEPRAARGQQPELAGGRRAFLLAAVAVAGMAAVGGVVARSWGELAATASRAGVRLPGASRPAPKVPPGVVVDVPGVTPYLTANRDFYRVDTALRVPDVPVEGWRLRVHGLVDRELDLTFDDLLSRRLVERRITMTCVSNPVGGDYVGNALWLGVPIHELLAEAGVRSGADAVRSVSADGFTAGSPLEALTDVDRGALVAVGMNGDPLPLEHGFPARMVTPGLYGYVSATKWLVELEVTRFTDFEAYWTQRGYSAEAPIKTSSRIDVPRSFARVEAGRTPVAGVAWARDRGVERVEVRIDRGPWSRAELGAEDSVDTWRQWVWWWDATPGNHTVEVRASDRAGDVQTGERAPVAPDGSTGWHSVNVQVT